MAVRTLSVTFEGPGMDSGVPVEDLHKTLQHVQDAVRVTVAYLSGGDVPRRGRPSNAIRQASSLRLRGTSPGSLTAELALAPPEEVEQNVDDVGQRALKAILSFAVDSGSIPRAAANHLRSIGTDLSADVESVWLGDARDRRQISFECRGRPARVASATEAAVLHGWLTMVNWATRKAQLHDSGGGNVALRFESALDDQMVKLATRYVKVKGAGRFDKRGRWTTVTVESIHDARSWDEPFDLKSLIEEPVGEAFDPKTVVTAEEPFDVEDFIDAIHRGRDVSEPWPQDLPVQP